MAIVDDPSVVEDSDRRRRLTQLLARESRPGQAAELDAFVGQRFGFLVAGLAVDAALVALAVMDLARLLGELVADMLAVLLDLRRAP